MTYIKTLLINNGMGKEFSAHAAWFLLLLAELLLCILLTAAARTILLRLFTSGIAKKRVKWDETLLKRRVFHKIADCTPGVVLYSTAVFFETYQPIAEEIASLYLLLMIAITISAVSGAVNDIYRTFEISRVRPIKGILQVLKIIAFLIIGIIMISIFIGKSPLLLLSGIGAFTAVFSLLFKDSILGLVAGLQLTSNDMLRIGDWIEMPKYGADGTIIDISLNTVKVQNFDKTIVTIPAYALVSDSFKNWRGMIDAGARRIKRSVYIDMNSIKFCTPELIERLKNIDCLKSYIEEKETEIARFNDAHKVDPAWRINGRQLTNIGTFRAYISKYIEDSPYFNTGMTRMIRQLPPGETGLPIEIYAFVKGTDWVAFERIQADLFDHILSIVGMFELRLFQNPAGYDLRAHSDQ